MSKQFSMSRRGFAAGLGAGVAMAAMRPAFGQSDTLEVTNQLGTYSIPRNPLRVVAVDPRLDFEPAVALGLPMAGYCDKVEPWVPLPYGAKQLAWPPNVEEILGLNPDLVICTEVEGAEDLWPLQKLRTIAPVLPVKYEVSWQDNLRLLGRWTDRTAEADAFFAELAAKVADIKTRHAAKVEGKSVAAIYYEPNASAVTVMFGAGQVSSSLAGQVLEELGGRTIDPALTDGENKISMENLIDAFGKVDAFLVDTYEDAARPELLAHPIFSRLEAAKAGAVHFTTGTFYGGGYGARNAAEQWDKVYALIA